MCTINYAHLRSVANSALSAGNNRVQSPSNSIAGTPCHRPTVKSPGPLGARSCGRWCHWRTAQSMKWSSAETFHDGLRWVQDVWSGILRKFKHGLMRAARPLFLGAHVPSQIELDEFLAGARLWSRMHHQACSKAQCLRYRSCGLAGRTVPVPGSEVDRRAPGSAHARRSSNLYTTRPPSLKYLGPVP